MLKVRYLARASVMSRLRSCGFKAMRELILRSCSDWFEGSLGTRACACRGETSLDACACGYLYMRDNAYKFWPYSFKLIGPYLE